MTALGPPAAPSPRSRQRGSPRGSQPGQPAWASSRQGLRCPAPARLPRLHFCSCQPAEPPRAICSPQRIEGEVVGR